MRPLVVASCDTDLSLLRFLDVPEGLHAQSGTDLVDAFSSLDFDDTEPAARQPLGPRQENSPQLQNKTANPKTLKRRQQRQKAECVEVNVTKKKIEAHPQVDPALL